MKVLSQFSAKAAMDGDGVNIRRVADFVTTKFDPFLMIDEIKSDDEQDFIGGFPHIPIAGWRPSLIFVRAVLSIATKWVM